MDELAGLVFIAEHKWMQERLEVASLALQLLKVPELENKFFNQYDFLKELNPVIERYIVEQDENTKSPIEKVKKLIPTD